MEVQNSTKSTIFVGSGVQTDCERLLQALEISGTEVPVELSQFKDAWIQRRFQCIYYGCTSFSELLELTEEVLTIAKQLWLQPNPFPKRVNRFILLALVYLKQPFTDPPLYVKIRLGMNDLINLTHFYDECEAAQYREVGLLFDLLYFSNAFSLCITPEEYGLEGITQKCKLTTSVQSSNIKDDLLPIGQSIENKLSSDELDNALMSLNEACTTYCKQKRMLFSDSPLPEPLTFVNETSCQKLLSIYENSVTSINVASSSQGCEKGNQEENIFERRKKIRNKAFAKKS